MKWVNLKTGDVKDSQKRPNKDSLIVVEVIADDGSKYISTLDGIIDFSYNSGHDDIEIQETMLEIFTEDESFAKTLKNLFPYYDVSDYTETDEYIEVSLPNGTYLKNALANGDDMRFEPAPSRTGIDEDELPSSRPQGGGGGKGMPSDGKPSDEEGEGEGEGEGEDGEGESEGDGEGEGQGQGEGEGEEGESKDPYEQGQESGDDAPDSLKDKIDKMMDKDSDSQGKPAEEGGEAEKPAPEGSEGGAPAENPNDVEGTPSQESGEGGEGQGDGNGQGEGEGDGDGNGESEGGDGEGDGEGDSDSDSDGDSDSDSDSDGGEGDSDSDSDSDSGDGDGESEGDSDSDSDNGEEGDSDNETDNEGKSDESGENDGESDSDNDSDNEGEGGDGEKPSDDGKPVLSDEGQEIIDAMKENCQDGKDKAEQGMENADGEEAREGADDAEQSLEDAKDYLEENDIDPNEVPEIAEMEEIVEEANEFAEIAEDLEEYINEQFEKKLDEGELTDEQFEEFKQGLLDKIFKESNDARRKREEEQEMEKALALLNKSVGKMAVKAVDWKTGKVKYFAKDQTLNTDYYIVEPIFTGLWDGGDELVVDNTIEGAIQVANKLGHDVVKKGNTSATFKNVTPKEEFEEIIDSMRVFDYGYDGDFNLTITYF